jgi:SOS-response transcriptional repressor LexA
MDITEIRRRNLSNTLDQLLKLKKLKNHTALAKHYNINPSYISQILTNHVGFGEKAARKMENILGLSDGDLDNQIEFNLLKLQSYGEKYREIPIIPFNQVHSWKEKIHDKTQFFDTIITDYKGEKLEDIFCTQANDLSMFPLYQIGDFLTIDPNLKPQETDYILATFGLERVVLRQYQISSYNSDGSESFNLGALNSSFPTYNSRINPLKILGVVVSFERKFHTHL